MIINVKTWIILIGIIIGAISYWLQPYNESTVLGFNIYLLMSIGAFLGSLLLLVFLNVTPSKIALFISLGVILAILIRIIYDIIFWDSTSHNLAPFEIIICGIITVPCAFAGAYLAYLIKIISVNKKPNH